jgi:cell division protein FtsB
MSAWNGAARNLRVPRFAEEAVERARLAVVPRQRRQPAPRVPFAILVGIVLLAGVAGLLLFNTHMQKNSFTATSLEARASALHAQEQALRMQVDELRDPQRLAERARGMGMVPPDAPAFLDLSTGTIVGDADASTGVNAFGIHTPPAAKPGALKPTPVVLPRQVITEPSGPAQDDSARDGAADRPAGGRTGTNGDQRD